METMASVVPSTFTAMEHSTQEQWSTIATETIKGKRDKAPISLRLYTFARVSAKLKMETSDYFQQNDGFQVRLSGNSFGVPYGSIPRLVLFGSPGLTAGCCIHGVRHKMNHSKHPTI